MPTTPNPPARQTPHRTDNHSTRRPTDPTGPLASGTNRRGLSIPPLPKPLTQKPNCPPTLYNFHMDTSMEILGIIKQYISQRGFAPSVRDIQDATNIRSTSTIRRHLDVLTDRGYITRTKDTARSIVLTQTADTPRPPA